MASERGKAKAAPDAMGRRGQREGAGEGPRGDQETLARRWEYPTRIGG
jgi:hypothetical protein